TIGNMTRSSGAFSVPFTNNGNGGDSITSYSVKIYTTSDNTLTTTVDGTSSPIAVTSGLTTGTSYYAKVYATNALGSSSESSATSNIVYGMLLFSFLYFAFLCFSFLC